MSNEPTFHVSTDIALRRSDFILSGDIPDTVEKRAFFVSYELDRRYEADRIRPYMLSVSFIETVNNIKILSDLALAVTTPATLVLETTTRSGRIASRRTFKELRLKTANSSYSVLGDHEVPLQRLVYECYMEDPEFPLA